MLSGISIFKSLISGIFLAGVLLAGAAAAANQVKDRFNPDGSFWIQGTPPPEFKDIGGINLNSHRSRRFPAAGVELVSGARLPFKTLTVKPESLTFTTGTLRGISYSFSGRFLKKGVFSAGSLDEDTPVLEGTLTKFRGGRKTAEAKIKFTYFGGT
jgi:hypothetical protein